MRRKTKLQPEESFWQALAAAEKLGCSIVLRDGCFHVEHLGIATYYILRPDKTKDHHKLVSLVELAKYEADSIRKGNKSFRDTVHDFVDAITNQTEV